jgi:hypothetical protein
LCALLPAEGAAFAALDPSVGKEGRSCRREGYSVKPYELDRYQIKRDKDGSVFVDVESGGETIRLFSQVGNESTMWSRDTGIHAVTTGAPTISTHNLAGMVILDWVSEDMAAQARHNAEVRTFLFSLIERLAGLIGEKTPRVFILDRPAIERLISDVKDK